jgi:1,4-alpha-glucan branching enzyme
MAPGRYQYKFVVNGTDWKTDPAAKETADDGYGGKNSVVVVGDGAAATATTPAPATVPATASAGAGPRVTAEGVVFSWKGDANTVHLAGSFNGWNTSADPLSKQSDGTWTLTKKLPTGTHEYKFVVNGTTWKQDEANPNSKDDGYGGKNSLVTVN